MQDGGVPPHGIIFILFFVKLNVLGEQLFAAVAYFSIIQYANVASAVETKGGQSLDKPQYW
ncbi:hypothetical protein T10_919 [Trichinella papuae]|uniref:Uncharacterized protein n=1 Tax=Trichinella papuae TaxID=268474 RepID=A0A0V1N055_9BILA|nr:hypothetical protein T10_919 [Trichinella papuae]